MSGFDEEEERQNALKRLHNHTMTSQKGRGFSSGKQDVLASSSNNNNNNSLPKNPNAVEKDLLEKMNRYEEERRYLLQANLF